MGVGPENIVGELTRGLGLGRVFGDGLLRRLSLRDRPNIKNETLERTEANRCLKS